MPGGPSADLGAHARRRARAASVPGRPSSERRRTPIEAFEGFEAFEGMAGPRADEKLSSSEKGSQRMSQTERRQSGRPGPRSGSGSEWTPATEGHPEGIDPALDALRVRIDAVDDAILEQLQERARLVEQVGHLKLSAGAPVYSAARERAIVERLRAASSGPFPPEAIAPVFREIVSATRSLERRLRVAFLGPAGSFAHTAARGQFGAQTDFVPAGRLSEVYELVERGVADLGVVPFENTTEGIVTESLDRCVESPLTLCAEIHLRVSQHLMSASGDRSRIRRVASHPQALAQCRLWLEANLAGSERVETRSTAAAAALAAEDAGVAAIASDAAAEEHGLAIVEPSIQDRRDNTTRFVVVGPAAPPPSGRDLTSVVFTLRKAEPGALFRLLQPFSEAGVNLTSIQSRPLKGRPWEYLFFVDLEGHAHDPSVRAALDAASQRGHSYRWLGSFPRALRPAGEEDT